jgi:DNA-binding transcriptional ArsR family regulator
VQRQLAARLPVATHSTNGLASETLRLRCVASCLRCDVGDVVRARVGRHVEAPVPRPAGLTAMVVLSALRDAREATVAELLARLTVSAPTLKHHLDALIRAGRARLVRRLDTKGRPGVYAATATVTP